ncbi:hypothetical protein CEXT_762211 [Caerostris extrusa]|uniref:Uncharacterized protein n=1 Tax=Caerostris extrusa TaxID=172846 RepID=A0AAV4NY34_CAEEX|nr:hypothetical protein CEXT_762211 [Caerostris extrusa]
MYRLGFPSFGSNFIPKRPPSVPFRSNSDKREQLRTHSVAGCRVPSKTKRGTLLRGYYNAQMHLLKLFR